jgi:SAM-dependent methyltransferase
VSDNDKASDEDTEHRWIREYWNRFYRSQAPAVPSQFAALVATELEGRAEVLELGCGNGRDSLFFASLGHVVRGVDLSTTAVERCQTAARDRGVDASFAVLDLSDMVALADVVATRTSALPRVIYCRFVIHAITEKTERQLIRALGSEMRSGERAFFEFRSHRDMSTEKIFGQHFRRFVDPRDFEARVLALDGLLVAYSVEGRGMAKYRSEDPFVARFILEAK